jgi:tricorn protease
MPRTDSRRNPFGFLSSALLLAAAVAGVASAATVDLPRFPALSPDGRDVVFNWRGDLWKAPANGGQAVRLTSNPADDLRAAWSPDGSLIAFESDREGTRNLYVMKSDGTAITQVTESDVPQTLSGFFTGPDGKPTLTFDATMEGDLYRSSRPYRVGLGGGAPIRTVDAFGTFAQYSKDGSKVLFERGGSQWFRRHYRGPDARDAWMFDVKSGTYTKLTDWAGNDGMPRWIGDDSYVFLSDRIGDTVNLFRAATTPGATATQLTDFKGTDIHWVTVSSDGRRAIVANWDALYAVDLTSGTPNAKRLEFSAGEDGLDDMMRKVIGREVSEAALSPDGQTVAMVAFGDVWVKGTAEKSTPRRLTESAGRERDIAWSSDGLSLFYVSDADGGESIFVAKVDKTRDEVRKRTEERLNPPKPEENAAEGPEAKAAGDKPEEAKAEPAKDDPKAASGDKPAEGDGDQKKDEKKGEKKDKKEKKDPELDPARWADAMTFTTSPVIHAATFDARPTPSPDNKLLAFRRGNGNIWIYDLETKAERELVKGFDADLEFRWSPDSKLIAYAMDDHNFNKDIWLIPADASEPARNVTRHPDSDGSPRFSADGKILAFVSERANEEMDVWCVFLEKDLEGLTGKDLDQYYKDAGEAAKKRKPPEGKKPGQKDEPKSEPKEEEKKDEGETEASKADDAKPADDKSAEAKEPTKPVSPFGDLDLDDAYLRVHRVTRLAGNEGNLEILPAGDKVVFTGSEGSTPALYTIKTDGTGLAKLGSMSNVQSLNFAGDRVVVVSGGAGQSIAVAGGETKTYDLGETIDISVPVFQRQKYVEAMRVLGQYFYLADMKGLDWPKVTQGYLALAERCRTNEEFDWVANRQLGELNASHMGVRSPEAPSPLRQPFGRLGARVRPVDGGFEVTSLVDGSPAVLAKQPLKVGDVITAIDFTPFALGDTIERALKGKVGKEVVVTVRRPVTGAEPLSLDLLMTPIAGGQMSGLFYEDAVRQNARLVSEWSNGQLGYIHIRAMDQSSLDDFERDLYAAAEGKKGLLIDVRNNGGGSTADLLLSSIMVQPHAYTIPRDGDPNVKDGYPQDRLFIQRYTLPINMLCNEKSFSNAEITSHAFRTLKRGTLVGQQTYGGVISTGGTSLLDGTTVRLPFRGWYLADGTDMENHGAMPDIVVPQTPEDESKAFDAQLKAAVDDLLKRVK